MENKGSTRKRVDQDVCFYSKSKNPEDRLLSTCRNLSSPIQYCDAEFSSIEHAFQAAKFLFSSPASKTKNKSSGSQDLEKWRQEQFQSCANVTLLSNKCGDCIDPSSARALGSRKTFEKQGAILNVASWNRSSSAVMRALVSERLKTDTEYYHRIIDIIEGGGDLFHFERSGAKAVWGGNFRKTDGIWVGKNLLGRIMKAEALKLRQQKEEKEKNAPVVKATTQTPNKRETELDEKAPSKRRKLNEK